MECCYCIDEVICYAMDVAATLGKVALMPEVLFDSCSFKVMEEENAITLDYKGAQMLDQRVLIREEELGNYVEATRVARHEKTPALAAAVLRSSS